MFHYEIDASQNSPDRQFNSQGVVRKVPYPSTGEILLEEFLKPMGITQYRLAKDIAVSQRGIGELIAGKRSVTTDTGLRLSRFFGMSEGFRTGLQLDFDGAQANEKLVEVLVKINPWNDSIHARDLAQQNTTEVLVDLTRINVE